MSANYPGLPAIAIRYWESYLKALFTFAVIIIIAGSFGGVIVFLAAPEAIDFYGIAGLVLAFHSAAFYIMDVWRGEYEPNQTQLATGTQIFAAIVALGVYLSGILLIATGIGTLIAASVRLPLIYAALVAAYYPVLDLTIMRRGWKTPGVALLVIVMVVVDSLFGLHESVADLMPVIGRRHRPQS